MLSKETIEKMKSGGKGTQKQNRTVRRCGEAGPYECDHQLGGARPATQWMENGASTMLDYATLASVMILPPSVDCEPWITAYSVVVCYLVEEDPRIKDFFELALLRAVATPSAVPATLLAETAEPTANTLNHFNQSSATPSEAESNTERWWISVPEVFKGTRNRKEKGRKSRRSRITAEISVERR